MGPLLVLGTWACALGVACLLGLPSVLVTGRPVTWLSMRAAMWTGLLIGIVLILIGGLVAPLRSPTAVALLGVAVVSVVVLLLAVRPQWRLRLPTRPTGWSWGAVLVLTAALLLATGYLAVAALGPVTNYDSGLYHLGAIAYAGDYSTIPGLANLYQAFGYSNSMFPFSAFLGNGPWDGVGYRFANGLFLVAMATDLVLRLIEGRKGAGTFVLLVAVLAGWVPLVGLSDYWVTSPTSDPAVMVFSLVSIAYLADAFSHRRYLSLNAGVALAAALLAFSMRPTTAVFLGAVALVVVLYVWWVRRSNGNAVRLGFPAVVGAIGASLVAVQATRDYLLSGWLLYPLSLMSFDVPWRALDPVNTRASTLGVARDPENYLEAAQGWSWVPGWFTRLPLQWEFAEFVALAICAVVAGAWARQVTGAPVLSRRLALLTLPSAVAVLAWWVASPPTFRFVWGPLFGLAIAPLGWFMALLARPPHDAANRPVLPAAAAGSAVALSIIVVYCVGFRLDTHAVTEARQFRVGAISVGYSIAPVPLPATREVAPSPGLALKVPIPSDQCWGVYPLCTPLIESAVSLRGPSIQDGFKP